MEQDAEEILSPLLSRQQIQNQFERLEKVVDEAKKRIDYTIAHDEDILKAIEVVERFLRKKKRVCYGGQAINSLLPKKRQFYDMSYMIPDYDFFTPDASGDVNDLLEILKKEGFEDISKKVGVHDGTIKVYVNYIPVADCSEIHPKLFTILQKRAKDVDGILFADPDFLRMMMYLELSRPRGEVDRWKKVYERLTLLNHEFPIGTCSEQIKTLDEPSEKEREILLKFCIRNKRVFVGPDVILFFEKELHQKQLGFEEFLRFGGPVLALSSQARIDGEDIQDILGTRGIQVEVVEAMTDGFFDCVQVRKGKKPLALFFQESACHSYSPVKLRDGTECRFGTPDLLLHMYYALIIAGKKEKEFFETNLNCLVQKLHAIQEKGRNHPSAVLPAFGLRCSGHQKGLATLLKEKAERTEKIKKTQAGGRRKGRKTRRAN